MKNKLVILWYYLKYKRKNRFSHRAEVLRYQARAVHRHLSWAIRHSGYYKKIATCRLKDFPIIEKAQMMAHFEELNTVGLTREEALSFALDAEHTRSFQGKLRGITVGLSSGTSHSRAVFLVSDKEKNKWAGYVLARYLPGSIFKRWNIAFFMRANSNLYEAVKSSNINFHFYDIMGDVASYVDQLHQEPPHLLVGQPSVLLMLADLAEQGKLQISPKRIISVAEVLEEEDAARIKEVFQQKILHQAYQCTEGFLASTCPCGTLHLNEDIVCIEKERLDALRFVPIITDFTRKSQPIIRYRLNDILVEKKARCRCGSPFLAIEKIEGREDDVFRFRDDLEHPVQLFPDLLRRCVMFAGDIQNYRMVQTSPKEISVYLDAPEKIPALKKELEKVLDSRKISAVSITFHPYTLEKGRKMKRVECLINK